ncbi:MAG: hypothetical protein M1816_005139 [Peltula sp. TS41687]|nr:MAG: hypothetical protein M1816_005139 [Peltula sp. TS41687]
MPLSTRDDVGFNPFDALGINPSTVTTMTPELLTTHYRRAVRHVFGDHPGTPGLQFPTYAQVNTAHSEATVHELQKLLVKGSKTVSRWSSYVASTLTVVPCGDVAWDGRDPHHRSCSASAQ